jgi:hypothetical protein
LYQIDGQPGSRHRTHLRPIALRCACAGRHSHGVHPTSERWFEADR